MTNRSNETQIRVGVIGMGPTGIGLAAHLIEAGAFVVPCDVDREKIDLIKSDGILLENIIEKKVEVKEVCYSAEDLGKYDLDLVIVAVKTPNLKKVLPLLSKAGSKKMFILCAQNGLGNEQEVANVFGPEKSLRMVVNYAGGMSAPNTSHVIFFNPPNHLAALAPEGEVMAEKLAALLNSADLTTDISDDIQKFIWEKAILNSALSPVCAITGYTMKDVMEFPDGFALVNAILAESIKVARAAGINFGDNFHEFCVNYLKQGGYHRPSMLVDLDNGLPTEIDYLNGKIAEYGKKLDVPSPINQTITAFIHMLEKRKDKS